MSKRDITPDEMKVAGKALARLAVSRGDRGETITALRALDRNSSYAADRAHTQLSVLAPHDTLADSETLIHYADEWMDMAKLSEEGCGVRSCRSPSPSPTCTTPR